MSSRSRIRVLIVDDSAIVRKILTEMLGEASDIEVVGTAPDPYVARDKILSLEPDVITLDIEMPRMDGLTFLRKLMHFHPIPAVVVSSVAKSSCRSAVEALGLGAVEVLPKPGSPYSVGELRCMLADKIRAAAAAGVRPRPPLRVSGTLPTRPVSAHPGASNMIVAMGASTGGTEAIAAILKEMPADAPGIVIVQHIPAEFSRAFADRLNDACAVEVKEAEDGDALRCGVALVSPGGFHTILREEGGRYCVEVKTGPRVCYQRPSADVLFCSVAEAVSTNAIGVLLTGMGADGAQGLLRMRQSGACTIAQDEATSVVFGMPRQAVELGAAQQVLPLDRIAPAILLASERAARGGAPPVDAGIGAKLQ